MNYYKHIDFSLVEDHDLLDFIENRQHACSRHMLELIILNIHSAIRNNPSEKRELRQIVNLLETLQQKMVYLTGIQESNLFPFLRMLLDVNQRKHPLRFLNINLTESSLKKIREEHTWIQEALLQIRKISNQFTAPNQADEVMKLCYAELKEFYEEVTIQLYREDQFLFPRIAAIESMVLARSGQDDAIGLGHGGDA